MFKILTTLILAALALILVGAGILYSGVINVGADTPRNTTVEALLEAARHRSIAARAKGIDVPDLNETSLIQSGAGNYEALCAACHLAPGIVSTELSAQLNPAPPDLTDANRKHEPARDFWTIKHGIKFTAMPAWGQNLTDSDIWGLVALLEQLPALTQMEYQALMAASGGHQHDDGDSIVAAEESYSGEVQPSGGDASNGIHRHNDGTGHLH